MKIKTSWTRLIQAANTGSRYLLTHPEKTKLRYAIERTVGRVSKINDDLQEQLEAIDIDHAATSADGVLLMNPQGGYQFKPDQKKKCVTARRALLNKEDGVEIEAYFATQVPDDIDEMDLDTFEGIVVRAEDAERIRDTREAVTETNDSESEEQPVVQ